MTAISTNFYLIRFIHKDASLPKVELRTIFDAVIKTKPLDVDESHIKFILENDLAIDTSKLDKRLIKVLSESLVYYMTIWPGWQRCNEHLKGDPQSKEWFGKFRMYLIFKSNFVIRSAPNYCKMKTSVKVVEQSTQTVERDVVKTVAPYQLYVGGPPAVLNNIVFVENNGDILIKQHIGKPWQTLSLLEFLNWPHVSVEVNLPEFSFTRTVSHLYERFIGLKGDTMVLPEIDHIIHIKKLQSNKGLRPYSINMFQFYILQLNEVLHQIPLISKERLVELDMILSQFLEDVKEINVYNKTMSTNACVGFHIGSCRYLRNKKMVSNSADQFNMRHSINFYEVINPQIDLSLSRFDAKQNLSVQPAVAFKWLSTLLLNCADEDVAKMRFLVNENCITYSCTLCNQRFDGARAYELLTDHFTCFHKSEQSVLCYKCGKQYELKQLAAMRWSHPCFV